MLELLREQACELLREKAFVSSMVPMVLCLKLRCVPLRHLVATIESIRLFFCSHAVRRSCGHDGGEQNGLDSPRAVCLLGRMPARDIRNFWSA
jgi:hypothetical protein